MMDRFREIQVLFQLIKKKSKETGGDLHLLHIFLYLQKTFHTAGANVEDHCERLGKYLLYNLRHLFWFLYSL